MNWEVIITALITAAGMYFFPEIGKAISVRLGKTPQERRDESRYTTAKTEGEISKAVEAIAAGSKVAIETLVRSNEYLKQDVVELRVENAKLEAKIDTQEGEIDTIKKSREESQANLKAALIDSRDIRVENAEKEKRITRLEDIVIRQSEYMDTQNTSMKAAGIPVPQNGELLESARKLKLTREERERLKEGK